MPGWLDEFSAAERRYYAAEREKREKTTTEPEPEFVNGRRRFTAWRPTEVAACDGCRSDIRPGAAAGVVIDVLGGPVQTLCPHCVDELARLPVRPAGLARVQDPPPVKRAPGWFRGPTGGR